ncbi:hypothetical protein ACFX15_039651 [Malus domestica]
MPHGSGQWHPRQALKTQSGIKAISVPKPRRSRPCPTPEPLFLPRDLLRTPGARWPPPPVHLRHSRAAEIPEANLVAMSTATSGDDSSRSKSSSSNSSPFLRPTEQHSTQYNREQTLLPFL